MAALENVDRLEWVGHGLPLAGDERRVYDLHRPFAPEWRLCVMQRPLDGNA
jgi:hypothetical protein